MADISKLVLEIDSSGVVKATGNLDVFKDTTEKARKGADSLDDVMNKLNLTSIASAAGILGLYKAFTSLVSSVKNFSKNAIDSYSNFEMIESGLQGVLKSAKKGTEMFEDLRKFSFDTTFGVDTLAKASTQLLNVGTSADNVKTVLLQLGNVAGGNTEKFNELVDIYSKIQNTGKATSMQLQQLALREVPIYQYLKKIGVQGNATGKQVAKAFEEMTKEGEQFYGAMERINGTISGKEGFVSDTFKELLTSFAEASGLADLYKVALDGVYEVLQGLVDWLQKINDNPVYQALLRGVLVAGIVAITSAIGVTLVGAIKKLNGHLLKTVALKALINPTGFAIGAAVAGIAGITAATISLAQGWKEAKEQKDEYFSESASAGGVDVNPAKSSQIDYNAELEQTKERIVALRKEYLHLIEVRSHMMKGRAISYSNGQFSIEGFTESDYKQYDLVGKKIRTLQKTLSGLERSQEFWEEGADSVRAAREEYERLDATVARIDEIYAGSEINAAITKYKKLVDVVSELRGLLSSKDSLFIQPEDIDRVNQLLDEFIVKKWDAEEQVTGKTPWQKALYRETGVNAENFGNNGYNTVDEFVRQTEELYEKFLSMATSDEERREILQEEKEVFDSIKKTLLSQRKVDQPFQPDDGAIRRLGEASEKAQREIDEFGDKIKNNAQTFDDFVSNLIAQGNVGGKIGGMALSALESSSGDVSNAINGFQQGGIWGAIIEVVIGALMNVAGELENFDKVMNPVTTGMQRLKPVIEELFNFLELVVDGANSIFEIISTIIQVLKPIFSIIQTVIKVILVPLKTLGLLFQMLSVALEPVIEFFDKAFNTEWLDEYLSIGNELNEEREKEAERLKALNEQYTNLLSAMEEMEEYYLEKRREINAATEIGKVTKVNDMILTPNGSFSTAPDDYIIATKNPQGLGKSSAGVNVIVNNYSNNEVSVSNDDNGNLLIEVISQKVANDFASGANGWKSAVAYQNQGRSGRRFLS